MIATCLCEGCGRMVVQEHIYLGTICAACAVRARFGLPNWEPWDDSELRS